MVEYLVSIGAIRSKKVKEAFLKVDRKLFVPENYKEYAYCDTPLPIGYGQTISAPSVIAISLEELELQGNERVLEIGTGSGYSTALLSFLSKLVISIERIKELADAARHKLKKLHIKNVKIVVGNGYYGYPAYTPYDRIIIWAAAEKLEDLERLFDQLRERGILISPVGKVEQYLVKCKKEGEKINCITLEPVRFVPLIKE